MIRYTSIKCKLPYLADTSKVEFTFLCAMFFNDCIDRFYDSTIITLFWNSVVARTRETDTAATLHHRQLMFTYQVIYSFPFLSRP